MKPAAYKIVLLVALLVNVTSCAITTEPATDSVQKEQLLWPSPPDQPRFRFEGILRSAADLQQPSEKDLLDRLKSATTVKNDASRDPVIFKPSGIAVRNGLVYVAEPAARAVTVFDIPRRKLFRFGLREPNTLKYPQAIALDAAGLVYVLDSAAKQVMVFDAYGLFMSAIPLGNKFSRPVSIAVNPDGKAVYVIDRGTVEDNEHKVIALDAQGNVLFRLGPRGSKEGEFNIPLAAAVDKDGTLYVLDAGNFRVQAFDPTGKFRLAFGSMGSGLGSFSRPRAIATDAEGNIYVTDAAFNNVQIFNSRGELLMPLGKMGLQPEPGNFALIAGVAVDEAGRMLLLDHYFKKIEVYSPIPEAEGKRLMANG
jgi:DNA-binding beta-propeller fold protein YncE